MNPKTWQLLDELYRRFPVLRSEGATEAELDALSHALSGLPFPDDYRDFLKRYGGAIVGSLPIFGVRIASAMGNGETVLEQNLFFRSDQWPGVTEWLVISADGFGNPLGIGADGRVWRSDHDTGRIVPVAASFEEFLRELCLQARPPS